MGGSVSVPPPCLMLLVGSRHTHFKMTQNILLDSLLMFLD
jgi:hypothetical protein